MVGVEEQKPIPGDKETRISDGKGGEAEGSKEGDNQRNGNQWREEYRRKE